MMNQRTLLLGTLAALLALAGPNAFAKGHLQVYPTLVEMQTKAAATRIVLSNTGDEPVSAQVRVFAWTQAGGDDNLVDTDQIVLSPPIVKIDPGQQQVVRLVRAGAPNTSTRDQNYRIVVEELPGAKANVDTVKLRMRYVMPMFVRAAAPDPAQLDCRVRATALTCNNNGGRAAQLGRTRLIDAKGHTVELSAGLLGYVLAGSTRQWSLDPTQLSVVGAELRLNTQLNGQPLSLPLTRGP